MAAYTNPGGIKLGDAATTTADNLAIARSLLDGVLFGGTGLNTQSIPKFDSVAALNAKFPTPTEDTVPSLVYVRGVGHYQWLPAPYNMFAPFDWKAVFRATQSGNPTVNTTNTVRGVTNVLTIGPYKWPHLITVNWRLLMQGPFSGNVTNAFVMVGIADDGTGGSPDGYFQVSTNPGSSQSVFTIANDGTNAGAAPTKLAGFVEKFSGPDTITAYAVDSRYTRLEAKVEAYTGSNAAGV